MPTEAFVVFDVDEDVMLLGFAEEVDVVGEELGCGFGDHDVDAALDGVEGDRVVGGVWREDGYRVARGQSIDGGFIGFGVALIVGRVGCEGCGEVVVGEGDVLVKVVADCWEFLAGGADHGEVA